MNYLHVSVITVFVRFIFKFIEKIIILRTDTIESFEIRAEAKHKK